MSANGSVGRFSLHRSPSECSGLHCSPKLRQFPLKQSGAAFLQSIIDMHYIGRIETSSPRQRCECTRSDAIQESPKWRGKRWAALQMCDKIRRRVQATVEREIHIDGMPNMVIGKHGGFRYSAFHWFVGFTQ